LRHHRLGVVSVDGNETLQIHQEKWLSGHG
jgi:hypothetical protein